MNRILHSNVTVLGFTLTLPLIAVIWTVTGSGRMSSLTLVAVTTLALGTMAVLYNTWRNSQPTEIISHVLRQAETGLSPMASVRLSPERRVAPESTRA